MSGLSSVPQKQYVIQAGHAAGDNGLPPLGSRQELIEHLSHFNTAPDREGGETLYGPGICIEFPPAEGPVRQMLMTITEEEIGWLVIVRLIRHFGWSIIDTETGRTLGPTPQQEHAE